jgi:hypothetical protein
MMKISGVLIVSAMAVVLAMAGSAKAQAGGAIGEPAVALDPNDVMRAREANSKSMEKFAKETIGATDEEWKVIQPKLEKVQLLAGQANGGYVVRMLLPMPVAGETPKVPEATQKVEALRKLLENKEAKTEDIKDAVKAYREARAKAQEELAKAQKELKEVLTVRQEALLVGMAILP